MEFKNLRCSEVYASRAADFGSGESFSGLGAYTSRGLEFKIYNYLNASQFRHRACVCWMRCCNQFLIRLASSYLLFFAYFRGPKEAKSRPNRF